MFYQDPPILVKELQDFVKLLKYYSEGKEETFSKCRPSFKILKRTNRASTDFPPELRKHNLEYVFSKEYNQKLLMEIPTWKSALERISTSPNTILVEENRRQKYFLRHPINLMDQTIYKLIASIEIQTCLISFFFFLYFFK